MCFCLSLYSRYIVYFTVPSNSHVSGVSSTCINVLHTKLDQKVIFLPVLCVCLGLKYGLHLFVNQKLKKTLKLDQLQRHGHKLSLTSASNAHSFHLAFEITKASNTHTNQCMPKGQMSYKVDMLSILQYTVNV